MIKLKTRIINCDEHGQFIEIKSYKTKHTSTAEHLCAINLLVDRIIDNEDCMTIDKLCKIIKTNYKEFLKDMEEE